MERGRPTKYTTELIEKAKKYLSEYHNLEEVIPSIEGLACYLKISRETIYAWSREENKEEFSDIIREILATQARVLMNKGLDGKFNASIDKLLLTKHGYSDRQELTGKDGEPLQITWQK